MRSFGLIAFVVFFSIVFSASSSAHDQNKPEIRTVAFIHVNVVPMDRERVVRDQTVVVTGGKIVAIGQSSRVKVPTDAMRIDAAGKYLIPALSDMHVHLEAEAFNLMLRPEDQLSAGNIPFEDFLFPYIANGVTTIQVLSATPEHVALQARVRRDEILVPRLVNARMIDGPKKAWPQPLSTWVSKAEEASAAVHDAKRNGYDKIKVYSFLNKESYDAIISAAREDHMDVVGHIPHALSVEYVVDAGQKMIAHTEEVAKHTHGDYSHEKIDYYAGRIANGGVWMTPTLITTRSILELFEDPNGLRGRPEAVYSRHPMQAGIWSFITNNLYRPIPADARKKLTDDFVKFQRPLTKSFHDKGGKLMTGTDSLFPGLVAGFAVHRELQEMVSVGLTPYEALYTSTTEPHIFLGDIERSGTVTVGKHTDLVLVNTNPLKDISAASKISGVLVRGHWLDAGDIDQRMKAIEVQNTKSGQ